VIVVDTNILLYLVGTSPFTPIVERLREAEPSWVAPRLWRDEFVNVLCTYERVQGQSPAESQLRLQLAQESLRESYEIDPLRTLALARRTGCSGYDSQYLALAEDLGTRLYTFDKRVLKAAPDLALLPPAS